MALNKLTADALVDGTLGSNTLATASVTNDKLNSNIISSQTAIGVVDSTNDTLLIYDNSTTSLKKVALNSFLSTSDVTEGTNLYYTDERVDDRVAALIVGGNNITATYNDTAGTLTIDGGGIAAVVDDTTPQLGGDLDVNSKAINFGDSDGTTTNILTFGVGNDLQIYHDSATNKSHITETGSSHLVIQGQEIQFKNASGTDLMALNSAQVELFFNGSKKLETNTSGITTTGTVNVNGAYTLPTTDGTVGQIMTTDGAGAVTFAAAGGGGSPDLFAENYDGTTTKPIATGTNAVAIGTNAVSSNTDSVALGGDSLASGYKSFAAVIGNTYSAYGASGFAAISIGMQSRATASSTTAVGPSAFASGSSSVALGFGSTASGSYSIAIGDSGAEATNATAIGQYALSSTAGKYSYASGRFASVEGSAQTGTFVLRSDTTDATPEALTTNNSTAGTTNQVILPNNSAYFFRGTIIARQSAATGTDVGAWEIKGAISREANAASTVLVKSTIDDFNVPTGWVVALTADTTNGGLAITVTGAAATNIRWVATINTSEVTY